jgi:hypothetical protein
MSKVLWGGLFALAIIGVAAIGLDPVSAILAFVTWSGGMKFGQIATESNYRDEHGKGLGYGVLMLACFGLALYFTIAMFRTHQPTFSN